MKVQNAMADKRPQLVLSTTLFFVLMLLINSICSGSTSTPSPPTLTPPPTPIPLPTPTPLPLEAKLLLNQVEGKRLTEGTLAVVVNAYQQPTQLDIVVEVEAGILFKEMPLIKLVADRTAASIQDLQMQPFEARQLLFPYEIDPNTTLSGKYVIDVTTSENNSDVVTYREKPIAFIVQGKGNIEFLPSSAEFDTLLNGSYTIRNTNLSVGATLEDKEQPTKGKFLVHVPSERDGYAPKIKLGVLGGIIFKPALLVKPDELMRSAVGIPKPIASSGSRILIFPFELDSTSFDGTYAVNLTIQSEGVELQDQLPIAVRVSSSIARPGHWLSLQEIPLPDPTATPTPTPTVTSAPTLVPTLTPTLTFWQSIFG